MRISTTQRLASLLATLLLTTCGAALGADETERVDGEFYVAVDGSDANSGSASAPFATLEGARDAIRAERAAGKTGLFNVRVAPGEYLRTAPFELGPVDSGTRYLGAPASASDPDGAKTIVSGGRDLGARRLATDSEKSAFPNPDAEIWRVALPEIDGSPFYFEQLFVDGTRAVRARFPNDGFLRPASVWEESSMDPQTRRAPTTSTRQELRARPGDLDALRLTEIPEAERRFAQFVVHHNWDSTRRILLGFNPETNALEGRGAAMKSWNPWRDSSLYYLENLRTAFDAPGEYFYAGTEGALYYRPRDGEKLESTRLVAPVSGLNRLVVVAGTPDEKASDIRFEHIAFRYTDAPRRFQTMKDAELPPEISGDLTKPGPSQFEPAQSAAFTTAVLSVDDAERIAFRSCEVSRVGEYGLWFKNCSDCEATSTDFFDLGAGAVRIGGVERTSARGGDVRNKIENCLIYRGGRFFAPATAVWIGQNVEEIAVLHNDISDFYYTGVSVGWVWGYEGGRAFRNRIEFNRIGNLGQGALADMGGVYTLGTQTGTRVCNNVVYNVSSYGYGGWGLYPDEGSEGILFENNLVYDTLDGSFHQHYGKNNVVRNNILARSGLNPARPATDRPHQIAITRVEDHLSATIERNIIYWKEGVALGYNADKAKAEYIANLWFNAGGEATFSGKSRADWVAETGKDAGGLVADPLFVDPDANDFRLKEGSPAEKIGFVPFDASQAGPTDGRRAPAFEK